MKPIRSERKLSDDKSASSWLEFAFFGTSESLYVRLGRSLFLFILLAAVIPSLMQAIIARHEGRRILEQEYRHNLVWQMRHTQESVDAFLEDHRAALRFLFASYELAEFGDQEKLHYIFSEFKKKFPNFTFVDLGLIDDVGLQHTYVGPYNLIGANYGDDPWFFEVGVRGSYTSDVFLGHRQAPHIQMAIKSPPFDNGKFWVLRTTINPESFEKIIGAMNSLPEDDVFIVNEKGLLQCDSRNHGDILSSYIMHNPASRQDVIFTESENDQGSKEIAAITGMRSMDWFLVFVQHESGRMRDLYAMQRWMAVVLLCCFAGVFMLAVWITRSFVGRLKQAEQEREAFLHNIEHTNKLASIGRLAAGVAHEINNPLAIINEMAGLMKDELEMAEDSSYKKKYLQLLGSIHSAVHRCRSITHRLLGFARRMDVTPEVIDMNDLLREVLGFLEKEAFHRSVKIEQDLMEHLPTIESDRGQLQQVFLNVFNNAMQAVEDGGKISVRTWSKEDGIVAVMIRDNGCGIPQDKLQRIFDPFFSTKGRGKGTGLGLSITYGIINKLGGKVSVESTVGQGTTFVIELPGYAGI